MVNTNHPPPQRLTYRLLTPPATIQKKYGKTLRIVPEILTHHTTPRPTPVLHNKNSWKITNPLTERTYTPYTRVRNIFEASSHSSAPQRSSHLSCKSTRRCSHRFTSPRAYAHAPIPTECVSLRSLSLSGMRASITLKRSMTTRASRSERNTRKSNKNYGSGTRGTGGVEEPRETRCA